MLYQPTQPVVDAPQKTWTLKEACQFFRVCDKTIRKWIARGRLRRLPDCAKVLITDESVRSLAGAGAVQ
jgi:hypothetical protein